MIDFIVDDMSCNHCASTITKAVKAVDPKAEVEVDLGTHRVRIRAAEAGAPQLADAIKEAGYTPVPA